MKSWVVLTWLLVVCVAAGAWQMIAPDPGWVLVRFAGWRMETSLAIAVAALLLLWGAAHLLWRFLAWPRTAWRRRMLRRGRERIADGLLALIEGRYGRAAKELGRAAHRAELHVPAQLALAQAAHARGDHAAAQAALEDAAVAATPAALAIRARFLLEQDKAGEALTLLKAQMHKATMPPAAWHSLSCAALREGDAQAALAACHALVRGNWLDAAETVRLEAASLSLALTQAEDAAALDKLWASLTRAQRRIEPAIVAYARRAAALGHMLAGMSEIEAALRHAWSETLARVYGELGPGEGAARLRQAESWLAAKPNSAGLLLTLGRLCNQGELWGKAHDYLSRGLALSPDAALWEAFGDACIGRNDAATAQCAYRNALLIARGEPTQAVQDPLRLPLDTQASAVEARSAHGVPHLR